MFNAPHFPQQHFVSWRKVEINWTDLVRNEKVLHGVKEERNILPAIQRRNGKWIGHILHRNCFLKQAIEVKVDGRVVVTGRREERRRQILDDLKETREFCELKAEALDRTLWRTRLGRTMDLSRMNDG